MERCRSNDLLSHLSHEQEAHEETKDIFHTMLGLKGKSNNSTEAKEFKPIQVIETLNQKARRLSKESYAKAQSV